LAKEPYKRDDILQKRPIILRSLLIVATPNLTDMTVSTENATSQNASNRQPQIPQYLAVKIQIEILIEFEFVPGNLSV